jgi:hypothetical protein
MTAFGTVGAVIVAVGIALWTERRSDGRLKDQQKRSDERLADERRLTATTLAEQRAHERAAVDDERAHGRAQLEEERWLAGEREQFAQASAVQVQLASKRTAGQSPGDTKFKQLAAFVKNRGDFIIRNVEVVFSLGPNGPRVDAMTSERVAPVSDDPRLRNGFEASVELLGREVLAPWDVGLRFESPVVPVRDLAGPYVVARWEDRWGTVWELGRGKLRQVKDDQDWDDG